MRRSWGRVGTFRLGPGASRTTCVPIAPPRAMTPRQIGADGSGWLPPFRHSDAAPGSVRT
ncbi:hypothetical protein Asru_1138_01 [Acidisphaera rubrifaciens HS-AP3]|uniref:Uncharacterized protein n=1 Tax=Acidisphaera rubrifaciens HS-AP3 TaxID=1231350 RepID=A0A0D6PB25_9PROT|nr:hypothetical protein Asru_1138_01 [Acidisphaera rubrifaciens HS-AP3]